MSFEFFLLFSIVIFANCYFNSFFTIYTGNLASDDDGIKALDSSDGGYFFLQRTYYGGGGHNFIVSKLKESGDIEWSRLIESGNDIIPHSFIQTTDDNLVVSGKYMPGNAVFLVKIDSSDGSIIFRKHIKDVDGAFLKGLVVEDPDTNNLLVSIRMNIVGAESTLLVNLNSTGVPLWNKTWGNLLTNEGALQSASFCKKCASGATSGMAFTALSAGNHFYLVLVRMSNGVVDWSYEYQHGGDSQTYTDVVYSYENDPLNIYVTGRSASKQYYISKINRDTKNVAFSRILDSFLTPSSTVPSVTINPDKSIVAVGTIDSGNIYPWLIKLDMSGTMIKSLTMNYTGELHNIITSKTGKSYFLSGSYFGGSNNEAMMSKIDVDLEYLKCTGFKENGVSDEDYVLNRFFTAINTQNRDRVIVSNLSSSEIRLKELGGDEISSNIISRCQFTNITCFGILANQTNEVCSGRGTCEGFNKCICPQSYSETQDCSDDNQDEDEDDDDDDNTITYILYAVGGTSGLGSIIIIITSLILFCFIFCLCFILCICICFFLFFFCSGGGIYYCCCSGKKDKKKKNKNDFQLGDKSSKSTNSANLEIKKDLFEINYDKIKLIEDIGSGGGGAVVYKAKWNSQIVAVKLFRRTSLTEENESYDEFERELTMMASISHPNLLRWYGCTMKSPKIGIVMEYCERGDLALCLHKEVIKTLKDRIRILREIASGVFYLHCRKILHRDLKPQNVLIDNILHAKIMDFGLSRVISPKESMTKRIGTSEYMSPEITLGQPYALPTDVYSYAIIIFVVLTTNIFPYGKEETYVELKVSQNPDFRPVLPRKDISILKENKLWWIVELMKRSWCHKVQDRPSFSQIDEIFDQNLK